MSDIIICVVIFVLIYGTLTMFYLAYRLAVMMDGLEKFLTDIKANGVHNDFQNGALRGLLCFYTEYFGNMYCGKKFLERLAKDNENQKQN